MPTIKELENWFTTSQTASKLNKTRQGIVWMAENKRLRAAKTPLGWLIDPKSVETVRESRKEESGR